MHLIHISDQAVIDAFPASCVGHFFFPFDTQDGDEIAALIEELKVTLAKKSAVGKDRKENILTLARRLNDVTTQHGLASRQ